MTVQRKPITPPEHPPVEQSAEWVTPDGQTLTKGTEITVRGMGRVTFHSHSRNTTSGAEWLDVFQPPTKSKNPRAGRWRAAATDAVTKVHRLSKIR